MRDASAALSGLKGEAPRPHFCGDAWSPQYTLQ